MLPPNRTADDVIAAARWYLGVPFGHQGRARVGDHAPRMDCVGLLFCVGEDLGLSDREGVPIRRFDKCDYGPQPLDEFIHAECQRRLLTVNLFGKPPLEAPTAVNMNLAPGEVLTLRVPTVICHAAIVTSGEPHPTMIYSLPSGRDRKGGLGVVETLLGDRWRHRIAGIFRFPGVRY